MLQRHARPARRHPPSHFSLALHALLNVHQVSTKISRTGNAHLASHPAQLATAAHNASLVSMMVSINEISSSTIVASTLVPWQAKRKSVINVLTALGIVRLAVRHLISARHARMDFSAWPQLVHVSVHAHQACTRTMVNASDVFPLV
jgi:hypothetical protein